MIIDLQQKILKLKKENDFLVLAHSYQSEQITEIADFCGDSYALAKFAMNTQQKNILLCGVRFMAEVAKILSPQKRVFLSNVNAGCPMAEQLDVELLQALKDKEPDRKIVAYINTTAELKMLCDVCVTSSSAVKILKNMPENKLLFIPDCNLGSYVQKQCPEKDIKLIQGGCPVHASVSFEDFVNAKRQHPNALTLVHPECLPKIVENADYVGSTSGIMDYALASAAKEFIIGTEISIVEHLQFKDTDKKFYALSKKITCPNMKLTTLPDVLSVLTNFENEIILTDDEIKKARVCIDKMLELGG